MANEDVETMARDEAWEALRQVLIDQVEASNKVNELMNGGSLTLQPAQEVPRSPTVGTEAFDELEFWMDRQYTAAACARH